MAEGSATRPGAKTATRPAGLSRKRKAIYAVAITLALFAGLELGFRGLGLFPPDLPFTIFKNASGEDRVRFNWTQPNPEFALAKPAGAFRIMVAGDSTAMGFPYHPRSSFGLRLKALLEQSRPGVKVEAIDLGVKGFNCREVEEVVRAALRFQPDLFIVYSGQNEFIYLMEHPAKLRMALRRVLLHTGLAKLRVFQALTEAATIGSGLFSWGGEKVSRWVAPPSGPKPIPADVHQQLLDQYRVNLARIVRDCRDAQVPLVISTMASNLRDWPPDLQAFPPGMTAEERIKALEPLAMLKELASFVKHREAESPSIATDDHSILKEKLLIAKKQLLILREDILAEWQAEFPGYAPITYELAWARLSLGAEAGEDFRRALSEEAKVVISHRAPPELNEIIRQTARSDGVWLLDAEQLFDGLGETSAGFDLFEDHCHPNLHGQQLIAEGLFDLLAGQSGLKLFHGAKRSLLWDEAAFQRAQGMDDKFRHDVTLAIGVYLGQTKDLPDRSAETQARLDAAAALDPSDPFPVLLKALVLLYYGEPDQARDALHGLDPKPGGPLDRCLAQYFTDAVDLRDGVLMVRLEPAPGKPPLSGPPGLGLFSPRPDPKREQSRKARPDDFFDRALNLAPAPP